MRANVKRGIGMCPITKPIAKTIPQRVGSIGKEKNKIVRVHCCKGVFLMLSVKSSDY